MAGESGVAEVDADDFARRYSMRAANIMWLLGAGASAAAGVPTAGEMIWEFKQQLFLSQRKVSAKSVADLSNPYVRAQLQSFVDSAGNLPAPDTSTEYADLFEAVWPNEGDRRTYLDGKLKGAKPSYGHIALATLMKAGLCKIVWTTNFDALVADACAKVFDSTSALTSIHLEGQSGIDEIFRSERWPMEVKLHGDFRSRRLKNTGDELRQQDAKLGQVLQDTCLRSGLVVVGYSGRDDSVMDTLVAAAKQNGAFPSGLFWLHRGDSQPLPRVTDLIATAAANGIDAAVVRIDNFEEVMRDLIRLTAGLDTTILDAFASERKRVSAVPIPSGTKGYPVVRLNALPVQTIPTHCRRVQCKINGYAEVRAAVEAAGTNILVTRVKAGVLAYGSDADVRKTFEPFGISEFDLHPIEPHRMRFDSGERGLLREAVSRALARTLKLRLVHRRHTDLLFPADANDALWSDLKSLVKQLSGVVSGHPELRWFEGIGVRLDWAGDRLWLTVEPRTVFEGATPENKAAATDFARERTVRRYNKQLNDLIAYWAGVLSNGGEELRALNIGAGIDAVFKLGGDTAFSRRIRS